MRWLATRSPWWLAASLAANLFFVALIGSALAFGPFSDRRIGPPPVRWIIKAAGPEARPAIEAAMDRHDEAIAAARQDHKAAKERFKQALIAKTVDPGELRSAIAGRDASRQKYRDILREVFVEVAPGLPQQVRRKIAERPWRRRDRPKGKGEAR